MLIIANDYINEELIQHSMNLIIFEFEYKADMSGMRYCVKHFE